MKIGGRIFILSLLLGSVGAAAVAQAPIDPPDQLTDPAGQELGVEQIGGSFDPVSAPQPSAPRSVDAPTQLSPSGEAPGPAPQLTEERGVTRASPQLYRGGRTAQPSEPLSSPEQGRTGAVARVEGEDRCDPADPGAEQPKACRHVIETRSAEFVRPDPVTLSPEQRLLVEQRLREAPSSSRNAARRLGEDGDADSLATQGVASLVLGNRPGARERPDEEPAPTAAEAAAILGAIGNGSAGGATPPQP